MTSRSHPGWLVPSLAASHLRHEWILTLCLVIALAAVIAPLLVLQGLKYGTIETLRERLVEDPVFREIRPTKTQEYPPEWFQDVAGWPGVAFLTPTILPLSSVMQIVHPQSGRIEIIDLIPTAPGDPLLLENAAVVPQDGEAVLTVEAARRLAVTAGDELTARITRTRAGRSEHAEARLRVAAVLSPRAGSLARIYAPLGFVLDVEAYKEGYAAPARGWDGETPEPYLSFDGAILLLSAPLSPIARTGLIVNTGFARIADMDRTQVESLLGFAPPERLHAYDLSTLTTPVTRSNLREIEQKLRGAERLLLPYVRGVELATDQKAPWPAIGLSLDAKQAQMLDLTATPWGAFSDRIADRRNLTAVLLPGTADAESPSSITVTSHGMTELSFTLNHHGQSPFARPVVPIELLGVLRTATQRPVVYNAATGRFEMVRGGYRGFRLYAASIDEVPALYRRLRDTGIETIAEIEAIERIRVLDAGLTRLFWLIALLGISGATAVLVASLYAAVERRRRDFAVLRLLGLARGSVFFFPIAQGAMIAALGLAAGFAGYGALALAINRTFASDLAPGERFCALPANLIPIALSATLALAVLASLVAAWRATRIDPAEAIREQ